MAGNALHTEDSKKENLLAMYDNCLELYPSWPKVLCRKADLIASTEPEIAQNYVCLLFKIYPFLRYIWITYQVNRPVLMRCSPIMAA